MIMVFNEKMKVDIAENDNENTLHSYLFSQQAKPHAALDALFSALWSFGKPFNLNPGDEFLLNSAVRDFFILPLRQWTSCEFYICALYCRTRR